MAAIMQHFFNGTGHGGFLAGSIVENWLKHPYGRLHRDSELMYSTTVPYSTIKPIRPAIIAIRMCMSIYMYPVFPDPVADIARRSFPSSMAEIPSSW